LWHVACRVAGFELAGGPTGRTADLTFSNDQGVYWKVQAVVVH